MYVGGMGERRRVYSEEKGEKGVCWRRERGEKYVLEKGEGRSACAGGEGSARWDDVVERKVFIGGDEEDGGYRKISR